MTVRLAPDHLALIERSAAAAYPRECCGLLVGSVRDGAVVVDEVVPTANVAPPDRPDRFEVDPQARFDLMRRLRAEGDVRRIVGHYHSHPDHPPEPSATDLSMAFEPDLVWLIVRARKDGAEGVRAFRPRTGGSGLTAAFDPIELVIAEIP